VEVRDVPEDTRECYRCGVAKPLDAFNWANRAKGKRQRACRACFSDYNRARYLAKGEHIRAVVRAYREANAEVIRVRRHEAYAADIEASRARSRANSRIQNPKRTAAKRAWARADRVANPEKWLEKSRRDYRLNPEGHRLQQHRRRALKTATAIGPVTVELLAAKWDYWAGRCWMCGGEAVEWDHVKPLARGGAHMLANLRPSCLSCNRRKSATWPLAA